MMDQDVFVVHGHTGHGESADVYGAFLDQDMAIACAKDETRWHFVEVWAFRGRAKRFVARFHRQGYDEDDKD